MVKWKVTVLLDLHIAMVNGLKQIFEIKLFCKSYYIKERVVLGEWGGAPVNT